MLKLLVSRVHSHARVTHHSLGPGGGDDNVTAAVGKRIAHIPKVAGLISVLHLSIRQGRQAVWTPVNDTAALINEALVIQLAEGLPHSPGAALVHGEAAAVPITGGAHLHLLLHDTVAVFLLPFPDSL